MSSIVDKTGKLPDREFRYIVSNLHVEQRADGEPASRTIVGYAATFDNWSTPIYGWFKEKISRGAFDKADFSDCIACFNHNEDAILARISSGSLKIEIDTRGVKFSFDAPNTTVGNDLLENVRRGDVNGCSFIFRAEQDEWVYADAQNGLEYDERTITSIDKVWDVSPVVRPAYTDTEVDVRHALEVRKQEFIESKHTSIITPFKRNDPNREKVVLMSMKTKL